MKPLKLCMRAIENSTKRNELVADFFGGSSSTLISADKLSIKFYMLELDSIYCDE